MKAVGFALTGFWLITTVALTISSARSDVLYRFTEEQLFDGKFGPVATVQQRVKDALQTCGRETALTADGKFGPRTRDSLSELANCTDVSHALSDDAEARSGAITDRYWHVLVGDLAPDVDARARTIMLTFEATDYVDMEWNFCQSSPLYDPAHGHALCFSNDPHSYLTWGPNGATAGGGREVQLILQAVDAVAPNLIDHAFGAEANALRKIFHLVDHDHKRTLETYLCGVWADRNRRQVWKNGFMQIGAEPLVRKTFDDFYKSSSLDGGKISAFFTAYKANDLMPTEIDYAFFKDRAAQTSVSLEPIKSAVSEILDGEPNAPRWKIRRAIALQVRPTGSQREDRLGRDVAFYIDGAGGTLSNEELKAWQTRGPLRASDVGLSDQRNAPSFEPGPPIQNSVPTPIELSQAEKAACPEAVLDTRPPR
jgi:hypothetical protein